MKVRFCNFELEVIRKNSQTISNRSESSTIFNVLLLLFFLEPVGGMIYEIARGDH